LVVDLNNRVMKRYGKSRRQLFCDLDRPELAALPSDRFVHGDWSKATVKLDYHVNADHHDYSVPYQRASGQDPHPPDHSPERGRFLGIERTSQAHERSGSGTRRDDRTLLACAIVREESSDRAVTRRRSRGTRTRCSRR
jgi:hypothetical protein